MFIRSVYIDTDTTYNVLSIWVKVAHRSILIINHSFIWHHPFLKNLVLFKLLWIVKPKRSSKDKVRSPQTSTTINHLFLVIRIKLNKGKIDQKDPKLWIHRSLSPHYEFHFQKDIPHKLEDNESNAPPTEQSTRML